MDTRGTPSTRFNARVSIVLSLHLTAWFALFPLLQVAHLTFAEHGHRFCNEHRQIEDVPLGHDLVREVMPLTSGGVSFQPSWLNNAPDAESLLHIACFILNHKEARDPLFSPGQSEMVSHFDQVNPLTCIRLEGRSPYLLLFSAPKTSPPHLTV